MNALPCPIAGVLTCYDRIVITGTLPGACYADGMTSFLDAKHIRIFDYPRFAELLRDRLRAVAEKLATAAGARVEFIGKVPIRKEDVIAAVSKSRGDHPEGAGACHFGHGSLLILPARARPT